MQRQLSVNATTVVRSTIVLSIKSTIGAYLAIRENDQLWAALVLLCWCRIRQDADDIGGDDISVSCVFSDCEGQQTTGSALCRAINHHCDRICGERYEPCFCSSQSMASPHAKMVLKDSSWRVLRTLTWLRPLRTFEPSVEINSVAGRFPCVGT